MLFIFDWDGTLVDSTEHIVKAMQAAARVLQLPVLGASEVQNIIGLGLPEAILSLYPELSTDMRHELKLSYVQHYLALNQEPPALFPGVADTLAQLQSEGHRLAVATGKSRRGLQRVLDQLGMVEFFHATRCADETQSKPHPQMLYELLDELATPVHCAAMVGDTEYDMAMARAVDMPRIGVDYGAHAAERLHRYEPDMVLSDFAQLLGWRGLKTALK